MTSSSDQSSHVLPKPGHTQDLDSYFWWHSIRLDDGRITPGAKTLGLMDKETHATFDPIDVEGNCVSDVGAWNGGFSIEAKRRGAQRVVAFNRGTCGT